METLLRVLEEWVMELFGLTVDKNRENKEGIPIEVNVPHIFKEPVQSKLGGISWQSKGKFQTKSGLPDGLVVHYTVSGNDSFSAIDIAKYFQTTPERKGFQIACPIMDGEGIIYSPIGWDIYRDRNNHAGEAKHNGKGLISGRYMGIEICNWGRLTNNTLGYVNEKDTRAISEVDENIIPGIYHKYTEAQEEALFDLCFALKNMNPNFSFDNVVGHDEIAIPLGRKTDPGGSLSMSMPKFRFMLKDVWENQLGVNRG